MAVQLKGQSTWDATAKAQREADVQALYDAHMLRPDDTVRFPKMVGLATKITGKPLSIASDGSINCSAGGRLRAIRPTAIEVKITGPRGGTQWVPLIPDTDKDD